MSRLGPGEGAAWGEVPRPRSLPPPPSCHSSVGSSHAECQFCTLWGWVFLPSPSLEPRNSHDPQAPKNCTAKSQWPSQGLWAPGLVGTTSIAHFKARVKGSPGSW